VKLVLAAGVVAMILGIVSGPAFIAFLRRHEFGQNIREEGPAGHQSKQGTPTMGGVVLLGCALLAFLIFTEDTGPGLAVAGTALACAGIGFLDDYLKLTRRRSLGLSGRWKLLLLAAVVAGVGVVARHEHLSTDVYIPLLNTYVGLGPAYYVFIFLVIAGAANAVNLTDGLDGLAAGTVTIAVLTYAAMMVVAFLAHKGLYPGHIVDGHGPHHLGGVYVGNPRALDLAIVAAALVGGCVGFLWYNAYPADVFMGDTGSFGLGGGLAALAIFTKTEALLVVVGGVFVIEALSVLIQVISFRVFGKRVFLMAPLHHHFEMMEWTENKIIVRFWITAAMFGASGFVLYYLFFSKYR
jgi:phospho-N-acetylmuramoyl-pentapeptide-transferase